MNHTCNFHIWCDRRSKLKGHGFGFLEKGTNCTQVYISQLSEIGMSTLEACSYTKVFSLHNKVEASIIDKIRKFIYV